MTNRNGAGWAVGLWILAVGCAAPTAVGYGPGVTESERDALHRSTPIPDVRPMEELTSTTVVEEFAMPPEALATWFLSMDLEDTLRGTEAVPGVRGAEMLSEAAWGQVGARRRVLVTDDSTALEQIVENDLPTRFRYVVWNYTSDAAQYIRYARGEFRFEPSEQGTRVVWTYAFEPNGWPASWFLGGFVRGDWHEFMEVSLAEMKAKAEADRKISASR